MTEFTGERIIPGQVNPDLWNEHYSRYLFAARLCRHKRVLDVGCGAGYGTAVLGASASQVIGLDIARDAIHYARQQYSNSGATFLQATATAFPFPDRSMDLVVSFELIEHLDHWPELLDEVRRVLAPAGQFIVSTPNKTFYDESRQRSGPNPYHKHEFEFDEFRQELRKRFDHVSLFLQNHGPCIVFQPVGSATGAELHVEGTAASPQDSNFFLAVCAAVPQVGAPTFVHVPTAANVLRERSRHIILLEQELNTKNEWLETANKEHQLLVEKFRSIKNELEERNRWAAALNAELDEARTRLDERDATIAEVSAGYEDKIASLERELEQQSRWAMETQQKLDAKSTELARCVDLLHETEKTVDERTRWAQNLDKEIAALRGRLAALETSRWVRLGRALRIGPESAEK